MKLGLAPIVRITILFGSVLWLGACTSTARVGGDGAGRAIDGEGIPDAVPRVEPRSKYGNPKSYKVRGRRYYVMESSAGYVERGIASWYGRKFHGRKTSSGEPYDMYAMTAAHKSLPLPTYARVTNLKNARSVVVRINDRGPFHDNRLIDLSYAAAAKLGVLEQGTGLVEVRALDPAHPKSAPDPVAKEAAIGQVFIQVGAFASRQNAEQMRRQLSERDVGQVGIHEGASGEGRVYRVRIGPLASVAIADETAEVLRRIGVLNFQVVID